MLTDDLQASYDRLNYPNEAYFFTDPAALVALSKIRIRQESLALKLNYHLEQDNFAGARYLEIGCARGGNLIPLAYRYPKMKFVGVDISHAQIQQAKQDAKALHLDNIVFYPISFLDIHPDEGLFDFVVAHGVLSWIEKTLGVALIKHMATLLQKQGIFYISYNTLPGWYQEKAIRDMMHFHLNFCDTAQDQIQQARDILDFASQSATDTYRKRFLSEENSVIKSVPDGYFYHDYLEVFNTPYYLKEVATLLQSHGLNYIGDTQLVQPEIKAEAQDFIECCSKQNIAGLLPFIIKEQYEDFLTNRHFRQSLAIKGNEKLSDASLSSNLQELYFLICSQLAEPLAHYELKKATSLILVPQHNENESQLTRVTLVNEVKVMALFLGGKYHPYAFKDIVEKTHIPEKELFQVLTQLMEKSLIRPLSQYNKRKHPYQHPIALLFSRYYAQQSQVTINHYHRNIELDLASRYLLNLCDGVHSVHALIEQVLLYLDENMKVTSVLQNQDFPFVLLGEKVNELSVKDRKELVRFFVYDALDQFSDLGLLI